jgi:pantoate--beta-alanine ligase
LTSGGWSVDYMEVRNRSDLLPPGKAEPVASREWVVLAAASLGKTRLIDNIEV